ncbi:MAG: DUF1080 domain-containing protein [Deltaproteobacteria bacterium]|nr:DUF1080 domain-containing protein [Deltaproteobacteria bacterium]
MRAILFPLAALTATMSGCGADETTSDPHLLLVTQSVSFTHAAVDRTEGTSLAERVFDELQPEGRFTVETVPDVGMFTEERLSTSQVVVFFTQGNLPLSASSYDALDSWIRAGGGFLGIHSATDTLTEHAQYPRLVGGIFDGHPWTSDTTVTLKVQDEAHPAMKGFPKSYALKEEIYRHKSFDSQGVRVLLSLDMEKTDPKEPLHVPVAWCKEVGQGRLLYTSLGHRRDVWDSRVYKDHLLGAIDWLAGRTPADATPNPAVHEAETAIAKKVAPAPTEEPTAMNTLTSQEAQAGWRLLFDGATLDGWRGFRQERAPDGWKVVDGALTRVGAGGDIITAAQFDDFELTLEWKVAPGGNSGVFFRVTEEGDRTYHSGPEMQVLDDAAHSDRLSRLTAAGSNYGLHAAPEGVVTPAGEWNTVRILVDGSHVEHWLNGTKVVEYELWSEEWEELVAASKFSERPAYGRATRGHIALQDHQRAAGLWPRHPGTHRAPRPW